jgi:oligopeptide/dipeptide ABC transporter ATP-binding protein
MSRQPSALEDVAPRHAPPGRYLLPPRQDGSSLGLPPGQHADDGLAGAPAQDSGDVAAGTASRAVLSVSGLSVAFRRAGSSFRAVDDVSFSIEAGQTVALVGESGSGKSVTSLAVMGLLARPPAEVTGRILFRDGTGKEWVLSDLPDSQLGALRGDRMAMIFQEPMTSLNPVHTVGEQISEALLVHRRMSKRERHEAAIRMLARVGIPEPERRANAYPHELSGGMRQRVMIGMALVCQPGLLIADEPTTALDVTIQAQILNDLKNLQQELGMAMLFVTHDLGVVADIAHAVVVMYAGQVVETGPARDILMAPRHPYTRALLGSIPRANADRRNPLTAIPGMVPDPRHLPVGCRFHPRCANAVAGRCDQEAPVIEDASPGRSVRCLRWREL